jgi:hypothetical protein
VKQITEWVKTLIADQSKIALSVTHPSTRTEDADLQYVRGQSRGVVAAERDAERRMLTSPELAEALRHHNIESVTYLEAKSQIACQNGFTTKNTENTEIEKS